MTQPSSAPRLGVGVVGAGRVGAVLGSALRATGHAVVGVSAVSEASLERAATLLPGVPVLEVPAIVERAELVLLTVPDDQLAGLVRGLADLGAWHDGQLVVHTAGRYGAAVLDPARRLGAIPIAMHPAMTFTGTSVDLGRLTSTSFAVTAPTIALPIAQALVIELGGEPVIVAEGDRALYHAALAHGANHVAVLVEQSMRALAATGVTDPGRILGPLVSASIDGALRWGDAALTGPVVRGDAGTVQAHLDSFADLAATRPEDADIDRTYRALALAAVEHLGRAGRLSPADQESLLRVLSDRDAD